MQTLLRKQIVCKILKIGEEKHFVSHEGTPRESIKETFVVICCSVSEQKAGSHMQFQLIQTTIRNISGSIDLYKEGSRKERNKKKEKKTVNLHHSNLKGIVCQAKSDVSLVEYKASIHLSHYLKFLLPIGADRKTLC